MFCSRPPPAARDRVPAPLISPKKNSEYMERTTYMAADLEFSGMEHRLEPPAGALRILIADDNDTFRSDLRSFLETQRNIDVVGEAGNGLRAINLAQSLRPDLILMDISMPGIAGPEAVQVIKTISPDSKIVFVTIHEEGIFKEIADQMNLDGLIPKRILKESLLPVLERFKKMKGCSPLE
jgi:YesN/AraC family two-component response regulator